MAATRVEKRAHVILAGIGAFMLLTLVLWMRNIFGVAVVLAWGVLPVMLARRALASAAITSQPAGNSGRAQLCE